jgi:uncharacterized protein YdeI (YjbR/CyaY-like superfamily)
MYPPERVRCSDLARALAKNRTAEASFDNFAPSHQKEYLRWFEEAKKPETRSRRLEQALERLAAGKRLRS